MKLPCCLSHVFAYKHFPIGAIALFSLFDPYPLQAQIVPDNTLPTNSHVTVNGTTVVIEDGTRNDSNLFHSFETFSVLTGNTALFNNPENIENIISRVTGNFPSTIDGIIRANGGANLFLINPTGIVFGSNAVLDIGGSFFASTANRINFADGTIFHATNPEVPSPLTVSVPVGLGFGDNPGAIRVQGTGYSLTAFDQIVSPIFGAGASLSGLRVQPGKTLALVGGDITLDGGILTAPGGRVELGSVSSGIVNLNSMLSGGPLGYEGISNFRTIQLSQRALADASGLVGGSIQVQGARVTLSDGSKMLIQNQQTNPAQAQPSGDINVKASESLDVDGIAVDGELRSSLTNQTVGEGNAGNITVSTRQLVIQNGAAISTETFSNAAGGNIILNVTDSVQVQGTSSINPGVFSLIIAAAFDQGNGGNLQVSTSRLTIRDGGFMSSSTLGKGSGGNVNVNADEFVELIGVNESNFTPSSLGASTISDGNAGNLTINTQHLLVQDGARVDASTAARGNAGSVTINASESIDVGGIVTGSINPSFIIASANIVDESIRQLFGLPDVPSGDSGNVTLNTSELRVTDGAQVTVRNDGTGKAGILTINAPSTVLNNQAGFTASTASGEGGDIQLQTQNLQLRHSSTISASAGGEQKGGNISINTDTLVALENSDITANAPEGSGGTITINTQAVFGTQIRTQLTPESDITAFGKTVELNGTVQLNTPDISVQNALYQLSANFVSAEDAIADSCLARRNKEQGSLIVTGGGGLASTPYDELLGHYSLLDERSDSGVPDNEAQPPGNRQLESSSLNWKLGDPIEEAQGMALTNEGRIIVGTTPQIVAVKAQEVACDRVSEPASRTQRLPNRWIRNN